MLDFVHNELSDDRYIQLVRTIISSPSIRADADMRTGHPPSSHSRDFKDFYMAKRYYQERTEMNDEETIELLKLPSLFSEVPPRYRGKDVLEAFDGKEYLRRICDTDSEGESDWD
jgi:hypothetical protein